MGKSLVQQRRGKGSPTFKTHSHRYKAKPKHKSLNNDVEVINGVIKDIVHCPGHTGPLAEVLYEDKEKMFFIAPLGVKVGDVISVGEKADVMIGNTLPVKSIPEGTQIYNIENKPGDGGKFVRSSGAFARVVARHKDKVVVQLPSKKQKEFSPGCRASIGVVAGSGRKEKPFYKAGKKFHAMAAKGKYYPKVTAQAMNAVDHPFGGSRSS